MPYKVKTLDYASGDTRNTVRASKSRCFFAVGAVLFDTRVRWRLYLGGCAIDCMGPQVPTQWDDVLYRCLCVPVKAGRRGAWNVSGGMAARAKNTGYGPKG